MRAIMKGIVVLAITVLLAAILLPRAYAGTQKELRQLLEGKRVVDISWCAMDASGFLPKQESVQHKMYPCITGVDDSEEGEIYYILYLDPRTRIGTRFLRVNKETMEQEVLWTNRVEV